ncbi:hypothetical protein DUNSADRAFT_1597 [Dunaliella salina]|uniref:RING-type domain-containing protein n=1 Tax=Dunaliella salina TaxID=3046 RepID=A0ABQ7H8N0_DUNSA|nr:hypothetical protein DUNSADRAFT_1597 [Dunaliella salina]|eukprot:KAF5843170.1 hypothetical protein DUNSADRAFT_1597 [Dunaliella salina]
MGKLKKGVSEAKRLLSKLSFPERKTNTVAQATAALFAAAKSGNAEGILNMCDAIRSQWRYLAFELRQGPGTGPFCMGPLCGDLDVEVHTQGSLLTSESVLVHILNATANKGKTVLSEAATNGHAHVVALLLQLGCNPHIADRLGGRTPLHYACFFGKAAAISALLDNLPARYQTRAPSGSGRNPGNNGRYLEIKTISGFTALHYCCAGGNVEALHTLLQYEPNIYAASEHASWEYKLAFSRGSTPLHIVAAAAMLPAHCMALAMELLRYYAERSESSDPRSMRDSKGMVPWQVAASTPPPRCATAFAQREQLLRLLHPSTNLNQFFDPSTLVQRRNCVATLASLAASTLREALLEQIQQQQQLLERMRFNDVYKEDPDALSSHASHPVRCDHVSFIKEIGDRAPGDTGREDDEDDDQDMLDRRSTSSSSSWSSEPWSSNSCSTMASSRLPSYVCTPRNVLLQQQQLTASQLQQQQLSALGAQLQRLPRSGALQLEQPSMTESVQGGSVQGNSIVGHSEAASSVCELCMEEEVSRLFITSCQHKVCANCAVSLVQHLSTMPVGCPYCRIPIAGFAAICSQDPSSAGSGFLPMPWTNPPLQDDQQPGDDTRAAQQVQPPNFGGKSLPPVRTPDFSSRSSPAAAARTESDVSAMSMPPPPQPNKATPHVEVDAPPTQGVCSVQLAPQQDDADSDMGAPRLRKYSNMSLPLQLKKQQQQLLQQPGGEAGVGRTRKMSTMSLPPKKNKQGAKDAVSSLRKDSTKSMPQKPDKEAKGDIVPSFFSMAMAPQPEQQGVEGKAAHKRNFSTTSLPPLLGKPESEAEAAPMPNFSTVSMPQMRSPAPLRTQTVGVA